MDHGNHCTKYVTICQRLNGDSGIMGAGWGKAYIVPADEGIPVTATPSQCSSSAKMVGSCARTLILGFAGGTEQVGHLYSPENGTVEREVHAMSERLVLERALVVGVDPHRESLDVIGICFPEEVMLDEAFANTRAGHEALSSKAKSLAAEHDLILGFGLEDGSNYGYALARFLLRQGSGPFTHLQQHAHHLPMGLFYQWIELQQAPRVSERSLVLTPLLVTTRQLKQRIPEHTFQPLPLYQRPFFEGRAVGQ